MRYYRFYWFLVLLPVVPGQARPFTVGILRYQGGDWYSCISSARIFLSGIQKRFGLKVRFQDSGIVPGGRGFYRIPFYIINGHGKVLFTGTQQRHLKRYLENGGFVFVNDDYGMDKSFRSLVSKIFPGKALVKLPVTHPLYSIWYRLPAGLPKIHKHSGKAPGGYGLFLNGRMVLYYAQESDIIDGWDPQKVHGDPEKKREEAFRIGYNILYYAMTR